MKIESKKGRYGEKNNIIYFTSTDKENNLCRREPITIFKLAMLVNKLTINELEMKNGFKRKLLDEGKKLFFEEAIRESIEMAKEGIDWGEECNEDKVRAWATKHNVEYEKIEFLQSKPIV